MADADDFLSVKQYALLLHIHPNTVRRAILRGHLNAFKIGNAKRSNYRIPRSEVNRLAFENLEKVIKALVEKKKD